MKKTGVYVDVRLLRIINCGVPGSRTFISLCERLLNDRLISKRSLKNMAIICFIARKFVYLHCDKEQEQWKHEEKK